MTKLQNLKKRIKLPNHKLTLKQQALVLENISLFLNRGYSLTDTLHLLKYRYHLSSMIEELEEGELMSKILENHGFDKDTLLIVEISEQSGDLALGMSNAYKIIEQKIKNKEEIKKLLKYPILLCLITICALGFVSFFLIPQFEQIYSNFDMQNIQSIKFLFTFIRNLPLFGCIILIVIGFLVLRFLKKSELERMKFCLTHRLIKKSYLNLYNHIFTINIVNLLKVGLKIDEIFMILTKQNYNMLLKQESERILTQLEDGSQLYQCLDQQYYLEELIMLIKEGETFSTLIHNLDNYVVYLNQKQEAKTQKMLFLIQPIFYGFFGILIVLLYATIFMPMFKMMEQF